MTLVKEIYTDLPNHMNKIFEPVQPIRVQDLRELNIQQLLTETYSSRTIHVESPPDTHVVNLTL